MMIEIRPLIQRTPRQTDEKYGADSWGKLNSNPEIRYVDIDNRSDMYELIKDRKFSMKHLQMLFFIKQNQEEIIGFNCPSAYNAWTDFLIAAEEFANYGKSKRSYGIDPLIMEVYCRENGNLGFSIYVEYDKSIKYVDVTLPSKEFMISLTKALKHFFVTMIHEYNVDIDDEGVIDRVERLIKRFSV